MRFAFVCLAPAVLVLARTLAFLRQRGAAVLTPEEQAAVHDAFTGAYGLGEAAPARTPKRFGEIAEKAAELASSNRVAMLRHFAEQVLADQGSSVCNDLNNVMFTLKASFERSARAGVLVDVGANTGQTTLELVRLFEQRMLSLGPGKTSGILGSKLHSVIRQGGGDICIDANGPLTVHSFEANPISCVALRKAVRWTLGAASGHNVTLSCALVSDTAGSATIFHRGTTDIEASASQATPNNAAEPLSRSNEVEAVTLDGVFGGDSRTIHLLKVDTEGFDPVVLRGARALLSQKRVKFLVFEYSSKWRSAGHGVTLKHMVDDLAEQGYACFFIKPHVLVPISGEWWQQAYELKLMIFVVNVFCGQVSDHDLFDAFVGFGTTSYAMVYALAHLQAAGSPTLATATSQ